MDSLSLVVFLSALMVGFGYVAGTAHSFNFWKTALLGLVVLVVMDIFGSSKAMLMVVVGAFFLGYLLPYARHLRFIGDGLSEFINTIRYRDAYAEIRRKEAEVEAMRRQYEKARQQMQQEHFRQEQQRRQRESQAQRERARAKDQGEQFSSASGQSRAHEGDSSHSSHTRKNPRTSGSKSERARNLSILGLDPEQTHSFEEIKKAYRRQASKYHPDKYQTQGENVVREMTERFKEIQLAFEKLATDKES